MIDFQETTAAQEVRFRCPHCQKLYCTQNDVFDTAFAPMTGASTSTRTEDALFDCLACEKTFTLKPKLNEFGLYRTESNQAQFVHCPKCSHLKPLKSDECPSCGILVSKFEELQKVESPALFELNQIWQRVLADFTLEESHQKFIHACHQKMALNFAYKKYSELKHTMGFDLACEHYMNQVKLRLEQQFQAEEAHYYKNRPRPYLSRPQTLFLCVGILGVLLLIFNRIRPTFPNLTGLVVAITILSFGLVFYSANSRDIKL